MDIEWTLRETIEKIKEWEGVEKASTTEYRLNNLEKKSLYIREELDKKLKDLGFQDGGVRLRFETGPVPGIEDIAIKIKEYTSGVIVDLSVKAVTTVDEWYI